MSLLTASCRRGTLFCGILNSCHTVPVVCQEGGPWGFTEPDSNLTGLQAPPLREGAPSAACPQGPPPLAARHLLFPTWNVGLGMSGEGEPPPGTWPSPCQPASRPTGLCGGQRGASKGMHSDHRAGARGPMAGWHRVPPFRSPRAVKSLLLAVPFDTLGGSGEDSLQGTARSERGQSP